VTLDRIALALYPPAVRDRYGDEIRLLLESSPTPRRDLLNVFCHALLDRTEYAVTLSWRRTPRYLLYYAVWLVGAYTFLTLTDRAQQWIIKAILRRTASIPFVTNALSQMRLLTIFCVLGLAVAAFAAGRRWWRGAVWQPIAALVTVSLVLGVVRVDTFGLTSFEVQVVWDWFAWTLGEQCLWAASVLLLIVAIRRAADRWASVVAFAGVVAVAYANTALSTFLLGQVFNLSGNPWTAYWESIMGALYEVNLGGDTFVQVHTSGWWPTVATALVAGCALRFQWAAESFESVLVED
jgi:hypothetical protein